ncbi:MAG: response regulator [Campylobacterota bacterium]|nr:response regulator [Campylobacterota bacterium]
MKTNNITEDKNSFNKDFFKDLTVLYIEDDETLSANVRNIFEALFFKVISSSNGIVGLNNFKKSLETNNKIDIIISDINMPKMNGIELLQKIREYDKDIPFIFTTAHSDTKYTLESIKHGISDYIIKPIDVQTLVNNMQKVYQERANQISIENSHKKLTQQNKELESKVESEIKKKRRARTSYIPVLKDGYHE